MRSVSCQGKGEDFFGNTDAEKILADLDRGHNA